MGQHEDQLQKRAELDKDRDVRALVERLLFRDTTGHQKQEVLAKLSATEAYIDGISNVIIAGQKPLTGQAIQPDAANNITTAADSQIRAARAQIESIRNLLTSPGSLDHSYRH
jgi:hypothetical protein